MKTYLRIGFGVISYLCALFSAIIDIDNILQWTLFIALGTFILQREWRILLPAIGRILHRRIKKVEKERHCVLCAAPPLYMIRLVAIDHQQPLPLSVEMQLHVCSDHHPNREIATKADELHRFIKRLDHNLTYDSVYPYLSY